ncbi:MAG: TonB C-terminal domain-containing protein [Candidatus Krumholzibacteria bacterium]|nr:TonB C-terminal domain-containing protein [Candidatus Krumholzibacteria bacterium]
MSNYRSQVAALAVSLVVHLLVMVLYRPIALMSFPPDREEPLAAQATQPLVFELVETPDDAVRERSPEARYASDKDAAARNETRPEALEAGEAYSEGIADYRIFEGRSGGSAANEPAAERPAAAATQDMVIRVPEDLGDIFNNSRIEKQAESRPSGGRPYTDDASYDQRQSAADVLGGITLNTYNWDFAWYILEMKKKLRSNVHPPGAFSPLGLIDGQTLLSFKVMPDGRVIDLKVIDYKGDRTLMETSVDAVEGSSPFLPLPENFPEEYLELTWTFIYWVYR